jgi:hypothetical protein
MPRSRPQLEEILEQISPQLEQQATEEVIPRPIKVVSLLSQPENLIIQCKLIQISVMVTTLQ